MAYMVSMPLVSLFTEVEHPRRPQARLHALDDILLLATLAVICDADSWTEVDRSPEAGRLEQRVPAHGPVLAGC